METKEVAEAGPQNEAAPQKPLRTWAGEEAHRSALEQLRGAQRALEGAEDALSEMYGGHSGAVRCLRLILCLLDRVPALIWRSGWALSHLSMNEEEGVRRILRQWRPYSRGGRLPK